MLPVWFPIHPHSDSACMSVHSFKFLSSVTAFGRSASPVNLQALLPSFWIVVYPHKPEIGHSLNALQNVLHIHDIFISSPFTNVCYTSSMFCYPLTNRCPGFVSLHALHVVLSCVILSTLRPVLCFRRLYACPYSSLYWIFQRLSLS